MSTLMDIVNYGKYAPYIWSSYAIVMGVIFYMGMSSFKRLARLQKDLDRIKGTRSDRSEQSERPGRNGSSDYSED